MACRVSWSPSACLVQRVPQRFLVGFVFLFFVIEQSKQITRYLIRQDTRRSLLFHEIDTITTMPYSSEDNSGKDNHNDASMDLEQDDLSDVITLLQEHFGTLTPEQQQDLHNLEHGKMEFEVLFLKYWNEDGTWKDQVADLGEYLESLELSTREPGTAHQDSDMQDCPSDSSTLVDTATGSCENMESMDLD